MLKYAAVFGLSLIGLISALLILRPPFTPVAIGTDADTHVAVHFWTRESGTEGPFRWTNGDSQIRLTGGEHWARASLVLRAQPVRPFTLELPATGPISATAYSEWRVYRVFVSQPAGDSLVAQITSPTIQPGPHDLRTLGVPLSMVGTMVLGNPDWPAMLTRTGFMLLLFALGVLLALHTPLRRWAWLIPLIGTGGFITATAILPAATSYWLPSAWMTIGLGIVGVGLPLLGPYIPSRWATLSSRCLGWSLGVAVLGAIFLVLPAPQRLLGMPLLVGGSLVAAGGLPPSALRMPHQRWIMALLLLALVIAGVARFVALDQIPFGMWRDEARYGLVALDINADPAYWPVYLPGGIDYPALLMYLIAVVIKLRGADLMAVRLVAALAGTLMPLVLYAFGRHIIGRWPACIAALLLAWSTWHVALSRISFVAVLEPVCTVGGLALLWQALHTNPTSRRRWGWFAAAGLAFGLALYTYHTARLVPLLALALAWTVLGRSKQRWRAALPGALITLIAATLMLLPLIHFALTQPAAFNLRVGQTALITAPDQQTVPVMTALDRNVSRYALMWHLHGEPNGRHYVPGKPMLDPLTGAAFLIGVIGLLIRRRPTDTFLLIWLGLGLLPALLAEGAPHAVRSVGAIAPALLIAGQTLGYIWDSRSKIAGVILLGLVVCGVYNLQLYFGTVPTSPAVWDKFYTEETALAQYARTTTSPIAVPHTVLESDVGAYLLAGRSIQSWDVDLPAPQFAVGTEVLIPDSATGERRWFAIHLPAIQPQPHTPYPGTNQPTFWSYTIH